MWLKKRAMGNVEKTDLSRTINIYWLTEGAETKLLAPSLRLERNVSLTRIHTTCYNICQDFQSEMVSVTKLDYFKSYVAYRLDKDLKRFAKSALVHSTFISLYLPGFMLAITAPNTQFKFSLTTCNCNVLFLSNVFLMDGLLYS
jgi:hypothetical protein